MKKPKAKWVAVAIGLIFLVLASYEAGQLQTGSSLQTQSYVRTQTYDYVPNTIVGYIISTNGTRVYAQNDVTGQIDYSGTDARIVINQAITGLTRGGIIHVKAGTYALTNGIAAGTISNVIFEGEGRATKFVFPTTSNFSAFTGGRGWTFRNFMADGTNSPSKLIYLRGENETATGLYIYNACSAIYGDASNLIITANYVSNTRCDSIAVQFANNILISNNQIDTSIVTTNTAGGIAINGVNNAVIIGNQIRRTNFGIAIENTVGQERWISKYINVVSNNIYGTISNGLIIYGPANGFGSGEHITISENVISHSGSAAMYLKTGEYVTVSNNAIDSSAYDGIDVAANTRFITLSGNVIQNPNGTGIHFDAPFGDGMVQGNTIVSPHAFGIKFEASSYNITISQNEIYYPTDSAIDVEGGEYVLASGNEVRILTNANGIRLNAVRWFTVTGNMITGSGISGRSQLNAGIGLLRASMGVLSSNTILGDAFSGIYLYNGVTNTTVTSNVISVAVACIREDTGGSDYNTISNNILDYCATPVTSVGPHDWVTSNKGYNPQAGSTITVGASPYTYTNNDKYPEMVVISGGTVLDITIIRTTNGVRKSFSTGLGSGTFLLDPLDQITVTYSVAPTMIKIPQ